MTTETAIKERPILFSGPMVRAILDGKKTQTRRVMKPWPEYVQPDGMLLRLEDIDTAAQTIARERLVRRCPYGKPGERLWVRETWATVKTLDDLSPVECWQYECPPAIYYAADTGAYVTSPNRGRWRPSIHMPRWASRTTLELTNVRVERVRDITEADCIAEGVQADGRAGSEPHKYAFKRLWEDLNAKRGYGWGVNPWVWVVEFQRVQP